MKSPFVIGGTPSAQSSQPAPQPPAPTKLREPLLEEQPPASGATQMLLRRDLSGFVGGEKGYVAGSVRAESRVGPGVKSYEWPIVANLENACPQGEHVAIYGRAVRAAPDAGHTWAGCFENRDLSGGCGHQVGLEVDLFGAGPDTSGCRVGVDVTIGPAEYAYTQPMEATYGVRVGAAHNDRAHRVKVAFGATIDCDVVFDASQSTTSRGGAALRLASGQFIALEQTNQIKLRYNPTARQIEFMNGDRVVFSIPA